MMLLLLLALGDCASCGAALKDRANYCTSCGARAPENPDEAEAAYLRGRDCAMREDFAEARRELDRAIALQPFRKEYFLARGRVRLESGKTEMDWKGAIDDFAYVLRLDPKHVEARLGRAEALVYLGRCQGEAGVPLLNAALVHLEDSVDLDPRHARAWLLLGQLFVELGHLDRAVEALDRAVALDPSGPHYLARARAKAELRLLREALDDADAAVRLLPEEIEPRMIRALLRPFSEAIDDYSEVLRLRPTHFEAWLRRGQLHLQIEQRAEAVGDLTKALALQAEDFEARIARGRAHYELRNFDAAIADWRRALELRPAARVELLPWIEEAEKSRGGP